MGNRRARTERAARFHTLSGVLTAERKGEWIELDFPAKPEEPAKPWDELGRGLGITPCYVGKSLFDYLVEADSEQTVRNLQPDFTLLKQTKARGVIVTARAEGGEFDFVSRFFAPGAGIDEDPVTGSAHCALGPFWAKKLGKTEFVAYQASARGHHHRAICDRLRHRRKLFAFCSTAEAPTADTALRNASRTAAPPAGAPPQSYSWPAPPPPNSADSSCPPAPPANSPSRSSSWVPFLCASALSLLLLNS